jgi:hypothetical protein
VGASLLGHLVFLISFQHDASMWYSLCIGFRAKTSKG